MAEFNRVVFESNKMDYATPEHLFDQLDREFHFTLDPAASKDNHTCDKFFTEKENGLEQSWGGERVFCNPPYGKTLGKWVRKAFDECYRGSCPLVVLLIPARTDTMWFHNYIYHKAEVRFIKGRLRFNGCTINAPFPSMIVIYRNEV